MYKTLNIRQWLSYQVYAYLVTFLADEYLEILYSLICLILGPFIVMNEPDEEHLLKRFISHVQVQNFIFKRSNIHNKIYNDAFFISL
jgi:hypothetical protein